MVKVSAENFLYFAISVLVNLLFLKILYIYLFLPNISPPQAFTPLSVKIEEIKAPPKKPGKPQKKVVKKKPEAVSVSQAPEKGDVPVEVKEEKEVSLLPELEKKIKERLKKRKEVKQIGEISAVVSKQKVEIRLGSRKLVHVPPPPVFHVKEYPSLVRIKIWVNPEGRVIRAIIIQRSGVTEVDEGLLRFTKKLKFEPIEVPEVQEGVITFTFST
ncbi:energy transducer TonB family protein [Aquifex aeolicus]|uniref:Uncharacterized protein aq_1982 n=1 Tax=Aquifex aeolicus (strain VF5) TaxID=224324 RepID=Y1982_AQUAE|nr:energy transducer TonB [Aquifex aeolicus]O67790.1 RecName: Full=Uncharacterized protein aq_1982 [Aquifex aeolicus VF5]AAC07757.1 putative protein [Aquifex aeolicus VF5]